MHWYPSGVIDLWIGLSDGPDTGRAEKHCQKEKDLERVYSAKAEELTTCFADYDTQKVCLSIKCMFRAQVASVPNHIK